MRRAVVLCAAAVMLAASAIYAFGDIARPKVTPTPGKIVFHTGLTVATDPKAYEARLQISEESLKRIRVKGIRTAPRDALLAETTTSETRGRAFGFERAMDSAGAVLGPILARAAK